MKRIGVALLVLGTLLVSGAARSSAVNLPPQASPVAVQHTHGPDGFELDRRGKPGSVPAATYASDANVYWHSSQYDGRAFTADQPDLTTLPTFHAIYLYPSDKVSRFSTFAAMFQADAKDASLLLQKNYGRGIRYDERRAIDRSGNMLDITVVRSQYTSQQLATTQQFSLVANELAAKFNNPNKKYMVWLDAGSQYCGQGNKANDSIRSSANQNEGRTLAIVYRPHANDAATGGFCRGRTLRHELGHNMGALQAVAPHAFDGAHCNDSAEDTMCYRSATTLDTGNSVFDYKNDDYWDPAANPYMYSQVKLSWWAVNNSKFICPRSGCSYASTPNY